MTTFADVTTLGVGGPARRWVTADSETELIDAIRAADDQGEPLLVLGGGSNVVVSADGFDGVVVRVGHRGMHRDSDSCGGVLVTIAAGEPWDEAVQRAIHDGLAGIEALSGIPGLTGATPIQNVGAYGQEVGDTLARIRAFDRHEGRVRTLAVGDLGLGYRTSSLKAAPNRFVVLDVTLQLITERLGLPIRYAELARTLGVEVGARAPAAEVRGAVLALRRKKGMVLDANDPDTRSVGSFFTNPCWTPRARSPCRRPPPGTRPAMAALRRQRLGSSNRPALRPATAAGRHGCPASTRWPSPTTPAPQRLQTSSRWPARSATGCWRASALNWFRSRR